MRYLTTVLLFLLSFFAVSQDNSQFIEDEDSLISGFNMLFENDGTKFTKTDNEKDSLNAIIIDYFYNSLKQQNSFNYPYSSIKKIGNIYSNDKKLRLITWNIKYKNGEYKYFGFMQHINKKKNRIDTWMFVDESALMPDPEKLSLYHNHWYGALYYQIIEVKDGGKKYYTLIGWDGNNYLSQKKIIDVLYFSASGKPKFGKSIFKLDKEHRKNKRLIFEYNSQIVMSVQYDKRYKKIIIDHLRPEPKSMKGQYEFYVTDGSYDALEFTMGKWHLIEEFDAQNAKPKEELPKIPAEKKQFFKGDKKTKKQE